MSLGMEHLIGKKVAFKLRGSAVHFGVLRFFDDCGFWVSAPDLVEQLQRDEAWKEPLAKMETQSPVFYFPIGSLDYLIAPED